MEVEQKHSLIQSLKPILPEIKQKIMNLTNLPPKKWWYLDKTANDPSHETFCFDPSDNFLITTEVYHGTIHLFNTKTRKKINLNCCHPAYLHSFSACFDSFGTFLAITRHGTDNKGYFNSKTYIINLQTYKINKHLSPDKKNIYFPNSEQYSVTSPDNHYDSYILAQYNDYTLEQLLFKKALLTWLLIEKPNKKITTLETLLEDVALKCAIPYDLLEIWFTFPENMRVALMETMGYRIQRYGKDSNENCIIQ